MSNRSIPVTSPGKRGPEITVNSPTEKEDFSPKNTNNDNSESITSKKSSNNNLTTPKNNHIKRDSASSVSSFFAWFRSSTPTPKGPVSNNIPEEDETSLMAENVDDSNGGVYGKFLNDDSDGMLFF